MNEIFEPRKKERLDKSFFKNFIFIFIAGILLIVGASYSLEFFRVNKSGGSYQFTTSGIVINVTGNNTINTTLSKYSDSNGIVSGLVKEITMTNTRDSDGNVVLTLERTSGVELSNIKYALYLNNVIVKVGTMPSDGVLLNQVILGNETLKAKIVLWVDENYTGSLNFNGTISNEVKRTHMIAGDVLSDIIDFTNITTATNNYVSFNNEIYRIVKIENDRVVICKSSDFDSTAASRVNSNKYNSSLTYTDNSIIYSHSTDNKNLYLVKTLDIKSGKGTSIDPFIFENTRDYAGDRKAAAYITYKDGSTTLFTQPVYLNQTNYISYVKNDPDFIGWSTTNGGTTVDYKLGDTVSFTSNTNLYAISPYVTVTSGCYTIKGNIITNEGEITGYDTGSYCSTENISIPSTMEGYTITKLGDWSMAWHGFTGSVTIPNSVITIGEGAFFENGGIESLTLGNNVQTIGANAFMENKIGSVIIPNSVISIGDYAFTSNALTSLTLGNNVETIGEYAFTGGPGNSNDNSRNRLTTLTIPDSVTDIGINAFEGNDLTTVTIGNGLTEIASDVFARNLISSLQLGSNVQYIYDGAFQYNNLTTVTIPDSVISIGDDVFNYNSLTSLYFNPSDIILDAYKILNSDGEGDTLIGYEDEGGVHGITRHYGPNNFSTVYFPSSGNISEVNDVCSTYNGVTFVYNGTNYLSPNCP